MRSWLGPIVDAILGRVPGKTGRLDTATRMATVANFSHRPAPKVAEQFHGRERDDNHLVKPIESAIDDALFAELVRVVNEAQKRDAEDERRLYDLPSAWPSFSQRERLDASGPGSNTEPR